ncbi:hypothetical protein M5361_06205 [Ligilactobacillus agilis]|nr:hypothetical protein [Ligilactobacillus agilis]
MYKAGRHWVQALLSRIGLLRVASDDVADKSVQVNNIELKRAATKDSIDKENDAKKKALRTAVTAGTVLGGAVVSTQVAHADTTQATEQNVTAQSTSDSQASTSVSQGSTTSTISEKSVVASTSELNTESDSSSQVNSTSVSTSVSASQSNSASTSQSNSEAHSTSETTSSASSETTSGSEASTVASEANTVTESESATNASSVQPGSEVSATNKDKLESLLNQADEITATDGYKQADQRYQAIYQDTIQYYREVLADPTQNLSDEDYGYGLAQLEELQGLFTNSTVVQPQIFADMNHDPNWGYEDTNTKDGDTKVYQYGDYKYIDGEDRLWSNIHVQTSRNEGQNSTYVNNNVTVDKEELGNGQTKWTVTFFPHKGIWYEGYENKKYGLQQAQMGFYLTKDYKIIDKINVHVSMRPNTSYQLEGTGKSYLVRESGDLDSGNVKPDIDLPFDPTTDINKSNGAVNNANYVTPSFANPYVHFVRYADRGVMDDATFEKNVFTDNGYDKLTDSFAKSNEFDEATVRDKPPTHDLDGGKAPFTSSFNKSTIGTAMYMQSWGNTTRSQAASYTVTFTTEHSNAEQAKLASGANNCSFSGIYAIVNSFQDN